MVKAAKRALTTKVLVTLTYQEDEGVYPGVSFSGDGRKARRSQGADSKWNRNASTLERYCCERLPLGMGLCCLSPEISFRQNFYRSWVAETRIDTLVLENLKHPLVRASCRFRLRWHLIPTLKKKEKEQRMTGVRHIRCPFLMMQINAL